MSTSASGFPATGSGGYHHPGQWVYLALSAMLVLIGVAVALAILFPGAVGHPGTFGMAWWWPLGLLFGLFWVLLIVLVLWMGFRWAWHVGMGSGVHRRYWRWVPDDPALAVARERYARGEISRDQYEQITRDLERTRENW